MPPTTPHTSPLISLALAALVGWRLYVRFRRMVGRQKLTRTRSWLTIALFSVLLIVLLAGAFVHPVNALALLAAAGGGAGLGVYGLRLTKFEATPTGLFYTPSAHIGIALSVLFAVRIVYRFVQVSASSSASASSAAYASSPLTLAFFGLLAGYYVAFEIGLLRWARSAVVHADPVLSTKPIG